MIGVALNTLDRAVSPTASVAAFLLRPRLGVESFDFSFSVFSEALRTGKTSIPFRISSLRMRKTLRAPALATAAKGTSRVRIVRVEGERDLRRGTRLLRLRATVHEALTAIT